MNWESELDRMLNEEQKSVDDFFLGDLLSEEDDKKKHGRPKLKEKSPLFDRCQSYLSEAINRLNEFKSKGILWKR